MNQPYQIAIVGAGPGGLSAAGRAAQVGLSHILLEASPHLANTIQLYQKGKHVMAEPQLLPLRSPLRFEAGKREQILAAWQAGAEELRINLRCNAEVKAIGGQKDTFTLTLADNTTITAERIVLAIGLQGNLRRLQIPGADAPQLQYQLDDPEAYHDETIAVIGAGDAAIENALALAAHNSVVLINRRDEFAKAKEGNLKAILRAIDRGEIRCLYNSSPARLETATDGACVLILDAPDGAAKLPCDRIIARLGADPPRKFVESCGISFPSADRNAVPTVSPQYESNVPGLYIIGALAGYPLIKQAINQGYEVVEFIRGAPVEPADEALLRDKFQALPRTASVDQILALIQRTIPLFAGLTTLQLREFMLDSKVLNPPTESVIFHYNDYTDTFFSVLGGEVVIRPDPDKPDKDTILRAGEFFGEMSLISGRRRNATALAGAHCLLIETPRRSMVKLMNSVESVKQQLDQASLLRTIQSQLAAGLLSADELAAIGQDARIESFKSGEALFHEGDLDDSLHLIRRGSVTISRVIGGRDIVLSYLAAGNYVGEMALLNQSPRSATVRATVATETVRLAGTALRTLLKRQPALYTQLRQTAQQRSAQMARAQSDPEAGDIISFFVKQGLGEATDVLLIDESLCVHCDNCERACADTHGGTSRLNRKAGPTFASLHVPTSCRHCEHPHCMKDCPPDAIHRAPNGEVFIDDTCIGCGNCEENCPYDVIQMAYTEPARKPNILSWLLFGFGPMPGAELGKGGGQPSPEAAKVATKCDMCKDLPGGAACVRACPTGAAIRVGPEQFMEITRK